jgi:hypothetical protein
MYIFMSCHHNARQNHNIKTFNKSSENVAKIKCSGMTVTYENYIHEENHRRLCSGNACYHLVQNLVSSHSYQNI